MSSFTNQTFDEIGIGATTTLSRRLSKADADMLAFMSGDVDPFVIEEDLMRKDEMAAEASGAVVLLSAILNRRLPGPGTVIVAQDLKFAGMAAVGDELVGTVTAREKRGKNEIVFDCRVTNGKTDLIAGSVTVVAPTRRISFKDVAAPDMILRRTDAFARLIKKAESLAPVVCAIVHPCDRDSLLGPLEAAKRGLIKPVLVGPAEKIRNVAWDEDINLSDYRIVDVEHSHAAAQKAVAMAKAGEVEALMKGSLHTDELMGAVVPSAAGLRTERRISHVFVLDVPAYSRLLMITDAAVNVTPDARTKADIVRNAIDLAHALGIENPNVAILAAVETVNPDMPATVDAAILCKMADRGQITGGVLDGPLAFDNAVSPEAARTKKIVSPVAGKADILLAPNLEAGNMAAKQLQYLGGAENAGIVLGARVPIVLTSRADNVRARLASTAVMALSVEARRRAIPRL